MKLQVDVKRAEQSYDFDSGETGSYLVIEAFGVELRIPVTDEQLADLIAQQAAEEPSVAEAFSAPAPRRAPATFMSSLVPEEDEIPSLADAAERPFVAPTTPPRELRPMTRATGQVSDDAGIAQG